MGDLFPVTFLVDRTGKIQAAKEGFGKKEEFESTIEKLLAGK
jgi:peroxiredoxin